MGTYIKSRNIVSINAALYILILSPSNSKTPTHYNKSHNLNCLHHHHHNPSHVVRPMEVIYGRRPNALGQGGSQSVGVVETRLCAMHLFLARFRNIAPAKIRKFDEYEFLSKWMKILDGRKYPM